MTKKASVPITISTQTTRDGDLKGLQNFLDSRNNVEKMPCYMNNSSELCQEYIMTSQLKYQNFIFFIEKLNQKGTSLFNYT